MARRRVFSVGHPFPRLDAGRVDNCFDWDFVGELEETVKVSHLASRLLIRVAYGQQPEVKCRRDAEKSSILSAIKFLLSAPKLDLEGAP